MEDNFGNLKEETYPSGFTIENMYNQRGFLTQVNNKQTSQPIWELLDVNSKGQPLELSLGNGLHSYHEYDPYGFLYRIGTLTYPSYTYDVQDYAYHFIPELGRPEQRFNLKGNDEHYYYDEDGSKLNRLSRVTVATHPAENLSMQYFSNGNISSKTGLGTYAYEDPQHLHAVTKVDNTAPLIPETRQDITYTPFNKVSSIIEGENELFFTYGTSNQRVKTEYYDNDIQKIKYFAGNYEQEIINGNTRELHYIAGPMGLAAIYVKNNGTDSMYYTHTDHLGSITEITDNTGTLLQRMQYDAWGKRSFITNNIGINNFLFDRGYTGHEHLDQFALINMNGRLYDPILGRMLSPDNYVQNATSTQGFNRYSYCLNNPMVYTDPDGQFANIIFGAIMGGFSGFMYGAMTGAKGWDMVGYIVGGAMLGAVTSGFSSGLASVGANIGITSTTAGSIAWSGISSAVVGGFAGGTASLMYNGNFWQGAKSGAIIGGISGFAFGIVDELLSSHTTSIPSFELENVGDPIDYNQENGELYWNKYNGKLDYVTKLYTEGTIPRGYYYEGETVIDPTGSGAAGATTRHLFSNKSTSYIFKESFTSPEKLQIVMRHEALHATYNFNGGVFNRTLWNQNLQEAQTSKMSYELSEYLNYGNISPSGSKILYNFYRERSLCIRARNFLKELFKAC